MNRRQFSQRLSALFAAPLIPKVALAAPALAATNTQQPYYWASFIARIHNKASPALFQRHLSLDAETANQIYRALIKDNVISPPNVHGVSNALNPFARNGISATTSNAFKPKIETASETTRLDKDLEKSDLSDDDSDVVNQDTRQIQDETTPHTDSTNSTTPDDTGQDKLAPPV